MNFIFLKFMKVWTQRVPCKVNGMPFGRQLHARGSLRSCFHEPQKNEIYFLNGNQMTSMKIHDSEISLNFVYKF